MPRRRIKRNSSALALAVAVGFAAPAIAPAASTYYIAPGGMDTNNGSIGAPFATFSKAISSSAAGDTILVRGGTYGLSSQVSISTSKNGTAANPFTMAAYPGETPVLDFHTQAIGGRGVSIAANYWRVSGLTIQYAGDNGMIISGSNNIVQQCVARQNQDSGFFIQGSTSTTPRNAAGNLLLNCDSYGNYDNAAHGENADGFAVKFRGLGPGNVLSGCRAWNNGDDGYDFWQAENGVTVQNSWAFHNGIASTFVGDTSYAGDGNGLKLGHDSGNHLLKNNLVWGNPTIGIDVNGNATTYEGDPPQLITHGVTLLNNTCYANSSKNYQFDEDPTTATPPVNHILRNNISLAGGGVNVVAGNTQDHNSWNAGFSASSGDFLSVTDPVTANGLYHPITDRTGSTTPTYGSGVAIGPRQTDGSLPDLGGFLRLQSASALIGAGVNVGLPYVGSAPDLGAYEFIPAGTAYWGLSTGGAEEPSWNWIAGVAPSATRVANYDLGNATTYTVNFASSPTHAGLMVRSGSVTLNLAGNTYTLTGAIGGSGTLTISGGGTVKISPNGGAVGTSKIAALNITGSSKLDLSDNHLITASAVGSWAGSNYNGVTGLVATGRGSSATWTGTGIITSQSTATSSNLTTLGVATAADIGITDTALWAGQTVTPTDTLVMYTYGGDANLDGKINVDDYIKIDSGIASGLTGWVNGDFNYDGKVNIDDYTTMIDQNIANQSAPFFTAGGFEGVVAIPEPIGGVTMILPAMLLAVRRSRRRVAPQAHR